jgi:hypothetical protein
MRGAWEPDWEERIRLAVRRLGYATLSDFLAANPGARYDDLVRLLDIPAAPVQIAALSLRDAARRDQLRAAAMDSLCRHLADSLPAGLTQTQRGQFGIISATSSWTIDVLRATDDNPQLRECCQAVAKALLALPARPKWLPRTPDDPQLVALFSSAWPLNRS